MRVTGRAFSDVPALRPSSVGTEIIAAEVDDQRVKPQSLLDADWSGREVLLTVHL